MVPVYIIRALSPLEILYQYVPVLRTRTGSSGCLSVLYIREMDLTAAVVTSGSQYIFPYSLQMGRRYTGKYQRDQSNNGRNFGTSIAALSRIVSVQMQQDKQPPKQQLQS